MNYFAPNITTLNEIDLAELSGPAETQYIANLQLPATAPGGGMSRFEFCFDYIPEGCEPGNVYYRLIPLSGPGADAALLNTLQAVEGENCYDYYGAQPGTYRFEVYVECDGKETNILSQEIEIEGLQLPPIQV